MGTTTKLLTYEEWVKLPTPNDVVEEVLDGVVRVVPPLPIALPRPALAPSLYRTPTDREGTTVAVQGFHRG